MLLVNEFARTDGVGNLGQVASVNGRISIKHDEITVEEHALTRPWTVNKRYRRIRDVVWYEDNCTENNHHVVVGNEEYFVGGDFLMPSRKGQAPPDLRYFELGK